MTGTDIGMEDNDDFLVAGSNLDIGNALKYFLQSYLMSKYILAP